MNATQIKMELRMMQTCCAYQHEIDHAKRDAIAVLVKSGDVFAPPLVVDQSNGSLVLDGHHRIAAMVKLDIYECEMLVIDSDDFECIIAEYFDGDIPSRLSDLDEYLGYDGRDD